MEKEKYYWPVAIIENTGHPTLSYTSTAQPERIWQKYIDPNKGEYDRIILSFVHDNNSNIIGLWSPFQNDEGSLTDGMYYVRAIVMGEDNKCHNYVAPTPMIYDNLIDAIIEVDDIRGKEKIVFSYVETVEDGERKIPFWGCYINSLGMIDMQKTKSHK